jgi:hypothetical protein
MSLPLFYFNQEYPVPNLGGGFGVCTVAVYADLETRDALVLFVEDDRNWEHTSITNAATSLAQTLEERVLRPVGPWSSLRWVEVYANLLHPLPSFDWILFDDDFERLTWRPATRAEVETLIGSRLEWIPAGDERTEALEGA